MELENIYKQLLWDIKRQIAKSRLEAVSDSQFKTYSIVLANWNADS